MLVRIVKMGFDPDKIETFLQNFEKRKTLIRGFEGCMFLELYRDKLIKISFSPTVTGQMNLLWKTIETHHFSRRYGLIPKYISTKNPKPGASRNLLVLSSK